MLKSNDERIIINDFIQGEPLLEENLDRTLELVTNLRKVESANPCKMGISEDENADKIRLLCPNKSIWIYSGYSWSDIWNHDVEGNRTWKELKNYYKRQNIIENCDVLVDGKYIDSQRDITLKWRGSNNQRVIDIKKSLRQNKIALYCD